MPPTPIHDRRPPGRPEIRTVRLAGVTALVAAPALAAQTTSTTTTTPAASGGDEAVELTEMGITASPAPHPSSPKFTAPLLDTPQTVSVIPREVFSSQGAQNLSDVLRNAPGITFLAGEGGNASSADGDSFFMRGFDASNNIFIDGVRDTGQYNRDVFNIEQVEIAKGPAGTDIGRGATSGYVNLATKVPRSAAFQAATASYGSGDKKRATIDINQPVAGDLGAAVRLNAMWQAGGVAGRDLVEEDRWAFAPSLSLGLDKPTRLHLAYERYDQDDRPDYGLTRAALPDGGLYQPRPTPVDQDTFFGTVHDFDRVTSDKYTARVEHDFSRDLRLSNQTRIAHTDRQAFLTAPTGYTPETGLVTRSRQGNERENELVSNITDLTARFSNGSVEHTLNSGIEYGWETQRVTSYGSTQGTDPANPRYDANLPTPLDAPRHRGTYLNPEPSGASNRGSMETLALYAFDAAQLSERWQLNAGLRWEDYSGDYRTTGTDGTVTRGAVDESTLSWKAGVVFKPRNNGSVYAAAGTSFRPPGTNLTASTNATNADNITLDAQEARNLELGTKWDFFGGVLSTSAALFTSKNTGVATTNTEGVVVQQNDQEVSGLELGVSGRIHEDWLVQAGVAFLDSEYSAPLTSDNAGDLDGARLQWTPKVSGSIWSTYRFANGLVLGGGAQYQGEVRRQSTNAATTNLPGVPDYWVVDLVASYPVNEHLTLRLNVNNVLDEFYIRSLNNNGNRYNPGSPRSFLLSAELAF